MIRVGAIILLIGLAFLLVRYRANPKAQKNIVMVLLSLLGLYIASVVIMELLH